MIYRFIDAQKADFPVRILCRVCEIPRSSYYDWVGRRDRVDERNGQVVELKRKILECHKASRGTYGSPRITQSLKDQGTHLSRKKVALLMVTLGISGLGGRRKVRTTRRDPHASKSPDLVERDFSANHPDELWVTDLTYIPTKEGWLFLVAIIDVYSRRAIGWSMADNMETQVFLDALHMAQLTRGKVIFVNTILHSDHGSQYSSKDFRDQLRLMRITQSMGSVGNSFDNAMAESLWASLKKELVYRTTFETIEQARLETFEWLNWYNNTRLHSSIGYLSPVRFEELRLDKIA